MKAWIVVATWVWWTAMVGPAWVCSLQPIEDKHTTLGSDVVKFTIQDATIDSYMQFIKALRDHLATESRRYEIPLLPRSTSQSDSQILCVELTNLGRETVTLALNVSNAFYVGHMAHKAENRSYLCPEAPGNPFPDPNPETFVFHCTYADLESYAGIARADILLGHEALNDAINNLYMVHDAHPQPEAARGIIVITQMVSEAARFRYIEQLVRSNIDVNEKFLPNAAMLSLEDNWRALCNAIQNSNQGVFSEPVELRRADNSTFNVDSVTRILIANLGLMGFNCTDQASQFSPLVIRSVVANDEDICKIPEPTVRISGQNAQCVDASGYSNGNPIWLSPCKSDDTDVRQLWTVKKDGTIRSNDKCLTSYIPHPVMIYACPNPVTNRTYWELKTNGFILHPGSEPALSANNEGNEDTTLTVEQEIYSFRQGWLASNNTKPFVTSIAGFKNYCLKADNSSMVLDMCANDNVGQKWAFYPDGSIRSEANSSECLASENHIQGANIIILPCDSGSSNQRWIFRNDGTISNLYNEQYVMEVQNSNPILSNFTGNIDQIWYPLL